MLTTSEPEEEFDEVQEAEHEVALVDDQVSVEVFPSKTEIGSAERFTFGDGVIGVESPLPPPPPPQETINRITNVTDKILFI